MSDLDIQEVMTYRSTMNVHLTPELRQLVEHEVASGRYASASEVIREGLRMLFEDRRWRDDARRRIAEGIAQAEAGRIVDGRAAAQRLKKRIEEGPEQGT